MDEVSILISWNGMIRKTWRCDLLLEMSWADSGKSALFCSEIKKIYLIPGLYVAIILIHSNSVKVFITH